MHIARISLFLFLGAMAGACSEAADLSPSGGGKLGDAGTDDGSAASGDAGAGKDGASSTSGDGSANGVVLNEVSGKGLNWIEVMNPGSAAVDVSGMGVCDSEKDGGGPKTSKAAIFPSGTILSPSSYLVVAGTLDDGGNECPDGGQSYCVSGDFGISNKTGEDLYLLAPDLSVVEKTSYPAGTLNDGETWGRLPNGTGTFTTTGASPGAANHAP